MTHLRSGQGRRALLGDAIEAFRRLPPEDYAHFLAAVELELGAAIPLALVDGTPPAPAQRLLAAVPATEAPAPAAAPAPGVPVARRDGKPANAISIAATEGLVIALLADGTPRTTQEIRRNLVSSQVDPDRLNMAVYQLRQGGTVRSEGNGKTRKHQLTAAGLRTHAKGAPATPRESAPRAKKPRRADNDNEDHRAASRNAEQIYSSAIAGHELLTPEEEITLAQRLEEVEVSLWRRVLAGDLGEHVRTKLAGLEPPLDGSDPAAARAADLDREIIAELRCSGCDPGCGGCEDPDFAALDREATRIRERFVACNLRMVTAVMRRYGYHHGTTLTMGDIIQEGNLGLIYAIPRFDYRRGLRFATFATWWIRSFVVRARANLGSDVRVPVHIQELASRVRRARKVLTAELGREPTRIEIAAYLKVSVKSMRTLESDWLKHRSSMPMSDSTAEEGEPLYTFVSPNPLPDHDLIEREEHTKLVRALATLPPYLANILRKRFGLGCDEHTLAMVGDELELSRERIRQLERVGLKQLRSAMLGWVG